jgi:hypothetical protein
MTRVSVFASAIVLSAVAGWFAIAGMMALFSGDAWAVAVMAGAFEVAKISSAVWIKTHWRVAGWAMRGYLLSAVAVLCLITSIGVFGYLSKAHLVQEGRAEIAEIGLEGVRDQIAIETARKHPRADVLAGLNDRLVTMREAQVDVGPLRYVAELVYGRDAARHFDEVVRGIILLIVPVFDPLAIVLWVAAAYTPRRVSVPSLTPAMRQALIDGLDDCDKRTMNALERRGLVANGDWTDIGRRMIYDYMPRH